MAEAVNRAIFGGERTIIRVRVRMSPPWFPSRICTLEAIEDRLDFEEARKIMRKRGRLIPGEKVKTDLRLDDEDALRCRRSP